MIHDLVNSPTKGVRSEGKELKLAQCYRMDRTLTINWRRSVRRSFLRLAPSGSTSTTRSPTNSKLKGVSFQLLSPQVADPAKVFLVRQHVLLGEE